MNKREFDVILLGASGFTGRLVAEYLLAQYGVGNSLRWAMAGRNPSKLEEVRGTLQAGQDIPILVADTSDADAMRELTGKTTVVCTTVGPYALYGSTVVEACAHQGTHYCDLTGEVQWMHRVIEAYEPIAKASGARIVHTCGFDSIPSDLGVFFLQEQMKASHGVAAQQVKYRVADFSGRFSGGTVYSMMNMMEEMAEDPSLRRVLADPYALNPANSHQGDDVNDQTDAIYDEDFGRWTLPFMMAGINTRVVRRSNALMNDAYGQDFRYDEAVLAPEGQGAVKSKVTAVAMSSGMLAMAVPPLRAMAKRFLPKPGEGPTKEQRDNGHYKILLHGKHPSDSSKDMRVSVAGDRDPGYGSTAKMLAESASCLALDESNIPGGFWTPASAMGMTLIRRLIKSAGLGFEVIENR